MNLRTVFKTLGLLLVLVLPLRVARAQGTLAVSDPQVDYHFGKDLTFTATLESPSNVQELSVAYQTQPPLDTELILATLDADNHVRAEVDLTDNRTLRAFSNVTYWYVAVLDDGLTLESDRFTFTYEDNRFDNWQTLEESPFVVHWYEGDLEFGRAVLDTTSIALKETQQSLPLTAPQSLDIYVYSSQVDLQYALQLTGPDWAAGHAAPDLGVILVSIVPGPEERFEMERQIPHELTHVMLYTTLGIGYAQLPAWLNEGIASASEFYLNPDYREALDLAAQNNALLPLTSLCDAFPSDTAGATLAYAESNSFINYLYDQYGALSLYNLVLYYAAGQGCDTGPQPILGQTLTGLEASWQNATFPAGIDLGPVQGELPWGFLALVILAAPFIMMLFSLVQRKTTKAQ